MDDSIIRDDCVVGGDMDRSVVKPLGIGATVASSSQQQHQLAAKRKASHGELSIQSVAADGHDALINNNNNQSSVRFLNASMEDDIEEDVGCNNVEDDDRRSMIAEASSMLAIPENTYVSSTFGGSYDYDNSTRGGAGSVMLQVSGTIQSTASANANIGVGNRPLSGESTNSGYITQAAAHAAGKLQHSAQRNAFRQKNDDGGGGIEEDIEEGCGEIITLRALTGEIMTLKLFALLARGSNCTVYQALHLGNPGMGMDEHLLGNVSSTSFANADTTPLSFQKDQSSSLLQAGQSNMGRSGSIRSMSTDSPQSSGVFENESVSLGGLSAANGSTSSAAAFDYSESPTAASGGGSIGSFNLQTVPLAVKTIFVNTATVTTKTNIHVTRKIKDKSSNKKSGSSSPVTSSSPKHAIARGVIPPALMAIDGDVPNNHNKRKTGGAQKDNDLAVEEISEDDEMGVGSSSSSNPKPSPPKAPRTGAPSGRQHPLAVGGGRKGSDSSGITMDGDEDLDEEDSSDEDFGGFEPTQFAAALNFEKVSMLKREVQQIMKLVRQKKPRGVLPYLGILQKEDCLYLCMRHCVGGSISSILHTLGHGLPLEMVEYFALALFEGLAALHDQHLTHKEIDCSAILLDWQDGNGNGLQRSSIIEDSLNTGSLSGGQSGSGGAAQLHHFQVYLSSFAAHYTSALAARSSSLFARSPSCTSVGSSGSSTSSRKLLKPLDVWAMGCTLLEMIVGKPLHQDFRVNNQDSGLMVPPPLPTAAELFEKKDLPIEVQEFFEKVFTPSHMERPSAAELLETTWMQDAKKRTHRMLKQQEDGSPLKFSNAETCSFPSPEMTNTLEELLRLVQSRTAQFASDRSKQIIEARKLSTSSLVAAKMSPTLSPQVSGILPKSPRPQALLGSPQVVPLMPLSPHQSRGFNFQNGEAPVNKRANRTSQQQPGLNGSSTARTSVGASGDFKPHAPTTGQPGGAPNTARNASVSNSSTHITPRRVVKT